MTSTTKYSSEDTSPLISDSDSDSELDCHGQAHNDNHDVHELPKRSFRPRPFITYKAFMWFVFTSITTVAILERFVWNVWPRQTYSIGEGSAGSDRLEGFKPGPWSVILYDVLAPISERRAIKNMQYCNSQMDASLWGMVAVATILLHVMGLQFFEGYCHVLPPSNPEFSLHPKRPAVYLLKIVSGVAMAFLLVPVAMKVYIPNMMSAVKALGGDYDIKLGMTLTREVPHWACNAEVLASTILIINYVFEIFVFRLKESKDILLHHAAAVFFAMTRVFPSSCPAVMDSEWLWWALVFHLTFSSLNIVRPCQSFTKHYLARSDYAHTKNLKALFHRTNVALWGINLCVYGFAAVVEATRQQGSLWKALFCVGAPIPMICGTLKEILIHGKSVQLDSLSARLLFRLVLETSIGLTLAPILLLLDYMFPAGMKKFTHKSSHKNTAGGVVLLRALCYAESWDHRVFLDDPFALQFVESSISRTILKSCVLRYLSSLKLETQHPGALGHMITRTKTIDESLADLTSRVHNPVRQLVILGAGYDTRAYRLQALKDVVVFEVDQQFMSLEKQKKCADLAPVCKELVHLSADFNRETVEDALGACDVFDPSKPTYFLWEGVQVYLSDDSVDRVFASIRRMNQRGGNSIQYLYFTFSDKAILSPQDRAEIYGGNEFYEYASKIGEKVESGIDPSSLETYLSDRGFAPYVYESCSGLSGHMTPEQKQEAYLSTHPFVRQSEVFHSCLVCNASQT